MSSSYILRLVFFGRMLDNRDAYSLNIPLACTTTW